MMTQQQAHSHHNLKPGETAMDGEVQRLGLAPKPITTGRQPLAISHFLSKTPEGLLEFRLMNTDVIPLQMLFVFILSVSTIIASMWSVWVVQNIVWALFPSLLLMALGYIALNYYFFKDINDSVRNTPPIRFHAQRQAILLSWENSNSDKPIRPDSLASDFSAFIAVIGFIGVLTSLSLLISFLQAGDMSDFEEAAYWIFGGLLIGGYPFYYTIKPWIIYFKQSRGYISSVEVFPVGWESLTIEYQSMTGVSPFGQVAMQNLTFIAPIPDHPEHEKAIVSLPVYSKEEALSLFELLCDYMENGAPGIEHSAANSITTHRGDYSREGYKRLILKRMRKTPFIYPFWRVLNWLTLRYFAHWYLEYQIETAQQKALNREDIQQWSQRIPEAQWTHPSAELIAANQKVRALYAKGMSWESSEVQRIIANIKHSN